MKLFSLKKKVVVITGGAGLLGMQHAQAVCEAGGIPVVADIHLASARKAAAQIGGKAIGVEMDVTCSKSVEKACRLLVRRYGRVHVLINNAARNPKVEGKGVGLGRVEDQNVEEWHQDIAVGLTGAMLCSRTFGSHFANQGGGVILNIASDLGLIAPDQRLYEKPGASKERQPRKPVSYSAVKHGLIGLTRYFATYWAEEGVRVNALCPGGVENRQPSGFLEKIARCIPMGRMARVDEYQGAVVFMCSDASSYMTGAVIAVDGGRTCW